MKVGEVAAFVNKWIADTGLAPYMGADTRERMIWHIGSIVGINPRFAESDLWQLISEGSGALGNWFPPEGATQAQRIRPQVAVMVSAELNRKSRNPLDNYDWYGSLTLDEVMRTFDALYLGKGKDVIIEGMQYEEDIIEPLMTTALQQFHPDQAEKNAAELQRTQHGWTPVSGGTWNKERQVSTELDRLIGRLQAATPGDGTSGTEWMNAGKSVMDEPLSLLRLAIYYPLPAGYHYVEGPYVLQESTGYYLPFLVEENMLTFEPTPDNKNTVEIAKRDVKPRTIQKPT